MNASKMGNGKTKKRSCTSCEEAGREKEEKRIFSLMERDGGSDLQRDIQCCLQQILFHIADLASSVC